MHIEKGYLRHFVACNAHDPSGFAPFCIDGRVYGRIKKNIIDILAEQTPYYVREAEGVALRCDIEGFEARSEALQNTARLLQKRYGKTFYNEMYGIVENWGDAPLAQIDRAAVPWFGARAWGVHVNGFVRRNGGLFLWIGKRSADRSSYAGQLDNMIGGGQPISLTLEQNLCKEAKEEAGVDEALALTARPEGSISYTFERSDGLRVDTLFVYDLELPSDFVPRNTDGEVESFVLMPAEEVAALIRDTNRFKFNCNMVITDFMMRHGYVTPEDKEYAALRQWLRK